jgi:hypothetical protein
MSRWGDYGRGGRAAADAAAATTFKSCLKDWGDVFWSLCDTSRKDWLVTRVFDTYKVEDILNRFGDAFSLGPVGSVAKGVVRGAVLATGIFKKEPREKIIKAAKSTATIVRKATKTFVEKVTPYVKPIVDKTKEIGIKTISVVSSGISKAWSATRNVVASAVETVSSGIRSVWSAIKSWF